MSKIIRTTTRELEETRNLFDAGETTRGMIPETAYRLTDVPESDNASAWAYSPDGVGAYWYGTHAQLLADVG